MLSDFFLLPEQIPDGLLHHLAAHLRDRPRQRNVFGTHLDAVLGIAAFLDAVSIKQRYAGHAKQAGHAAIAAGASARDGRYVVVVDEDIDPTNLKEVLWAMMTRVDARTDIEIIEGCWSTPLDPRMAPEQKKNKDHTNSRAIFYAVRPFAWRDKFPKVSRVRRELRDEVVNKFKEFLPFPRS